MVLWRPHLVVEFPVLRHDVPELQRVVDRLVTVAVAGVVGENHAAAANDQAGNASERERKKTISIHKVRELGGFLGFQQSQYSLVVSECTWLALPAGGYSYMMCCVRS